MIEARGSTSKKEFKRFFEIALKSSNETKYWLEIIKSYSNTNEAVEINILIEEITQISKILGKSVITLKSNL